MNEVTLYFQWKEGYKPKNGYFANYRRNIDFDTVKSEVEGMLEDVREVATEITITIK